MSTERIIDRVRKMLALANDSGATEGERDNALRMAHATLAKHNLSLDSLQAKEDPRGQTFTTFYGRPWACYVSSVIADLFFCTYIYSPASKASDIGHYFIGKKSNGETAAEISRWLVATISREGKRRQSQLCEDNGWFRTFAWSAAGRIGQRVAEMKRRDDIPSAPGTSLVLADVYQVEKTENARWVEENMKIRNGKSRAKALPEKASARVLGTKLGSEVHLGGQVTHETKNVVALASPAIV